MPALVCRISPARSIRRWETICASEGFSFMVGRKYWLIRMAADCREQPLQRQTEAYSGWFCTGRCPHTATTEGTIDGGTANARATVQTERKQDERAHRGRGRR